MKRQTERKFKSKGTLNTKEFWSWVKKPSRTQILARKKDAVVAKIQAFVRG